MKGLADGLPDTPSQQPTLVSSAEDEIESRETSLLLPELPDVESRTAPKPCEDVVTRGVGRSSQQLGQSSSVATTSTPKDPAP